MNDLVFADQNRSQAVATALQNCPEVYRRAARVFFDYLEQNNVESIGERVLDDYKTFLGRNHTNGRMAGRQYSGATVNHYLDAAVKVLRYMLDHAGDLPAAEYMAIEKAIKVRRIKRESSGVAVENCLTVEDVERFLSRCPDQKIALMFEFLWHTGVRVSEMLNVHKADLKRHGQYYRIVNLKCKGSKERTVYTPADLIQRINAVFKGKVYLFESRNGGKRRPGQEPDRRYRREYVSMRIKRLGRKILNREISAHTLRHSFATHIYKKTKNVRALQQALGHSSPAITLQMYFDDRFSPDELIDLTALGK